MSCFSLIRPEVNRIWPYTAVLRNHFNNYRLVATQASTDQIKITDEVLNQFISQVENNDVSNKVTCTAYIEKLCELGSILDAARLLKSLHAKQIFLSPKTYNMLVTVVGKKRNYGMLSQIFKDVLLSCNILGSDFYLNLAKAFSSMEDSGPLRKFIGELSDTKFPNGTIVMNKMIIGFAKSKQIEKAVMIFDLMKNLNCKPDLVTYNILLDVLGTSGWIDEMLLVFASIKESSLSPDIISYNTLINNLRKSGRLDLCLVFFREMSETEVDPDLRTYTALIDSFGRSGHVEKALGLLGQMKKKGIHPSIYNYRSLVSNLKKVGKSKLAVSLLEEMNSSVSDFQTWKKWTKKSRFTPPHQCRL
ncbi:Pentatricopeptide repeat-containing protein [Thalictrum thalictroides]|uniref:Pentatricopeptide repeat-containing protein n=1 Tax=Thalictrum thalictroides TaxID=46969 RepID=A0A7J6W4U5_THATH|nr:Pentatricopeptide repeat-containing protein [Thalictrum thalictroides]